MIKAFKYLCRTALFGAAALAVASCADEYSMPAPNISPDQLVEGVAFSVTHDAENPNIIHIKSLLDPKYAVAWITPQGRRNTQEVTLKIPFDGEYEVSMGVDTRGGYVWGNPYSFNVDDFCAEFVDHYLWTRLSGGVGNSKTWQLDLAVLDDGSTKTTYWGGPHWYWNPNYTWDHLHAAIENESVNANYRDSDPWDKADAINPNDVPPSDGDNANWYWPADYAGNSWMCGAANYGYITFDLINGANVTISDADGNVIEKGNYLLDTDNHTLTFSGVYPLNSSNNGVKTRECKLLYLSDTAMQIIADGLTEGSATSANYVTKDYFENYSAEDVVKEPSLPEGWRNDVSQTVITSVKWVLSDKNPLDWANLDGSLMNGWTKPEDYPDWLGTPNPASYADFSMTLDSKDNSAVFHYPDGSEISCNYELDDKGIYSFTQPIAGFNVVGWAWFNVDSKNQLRITGIEKDVMGNVSGMWLGAISNDKPEYMAYHFVPQAGNSGAGADPLAPWISGLCGKTFAPNTGAFVDWLNFDCTGGWTAPSVFGDDYKSNSWVWDEKVAAVAKSARLSFTKANGKIMASLSYTMADGTQVNESGIIDVNNDNPSITFPFPMVDYSGTAANWVGNLNDKGSYYVKPLAENEWLWLSHPAIGNNLGNVDEKGFWLARVSNASAAGNDKDELLGFWWSLVE